VPRVDGWSDEEIEQRVSTLATVVKRAWRSIVRKIVAGSKTRALSLDDIQDIPALWMNRVDGPVAGYIGNVLLDGAGRVQQSLALSPTEVPADWALTEDAVEEYLKTATNRLVGVGDDVWQAVRASLLEGHAANDDMTQLAARVRHTAGVSDGRAMTIARTEVHAALEAGSYLQALAVDPDGKKTWLATNDDRTRETHRLAEGQVQSIDQPFNVGGSALQFPGDPHGEPGEIINCRCSVGYDLFPNMAEEDIISYVSDISDGVTAALVAAGDWEAHEHPRGNDGKFITKGTALYTVAKGLVPGKSADFHAAIFAVTPDAWNKLKPEQKASIRKTALATATDYQATKDHLNFLKDSEPIAFTSVLGKPKIKASKTPAVPADVYKKWTDGHVIAMTNTDDERFVWNTSKNKYELQEFDSKNDTWKVHSTHTKKSTYDTIMGDKDLWKKPSAQDTTTVIPAIAPVIVPKADVTPTVTSVNAPVGKPGDVDYVMNASKPDVNELKFKNKSKTGVTQSPIYTDANGQNWILKKPFTESDDSALDLEVATSTLQRRMGLKGPAVHVVTLNGNKRAAQAMFNAKDAFPPNTFSPTTLSQTDIIDLQKEQVHDWLIGNNDSHSGNFLRLPDGTITSIDKGHALRFYGNDKLSPDYSPWSTIGGNKTTYQDMWKSYRNGNNIVMNDPNKGAIGDVIKQTMAIPDDEIRDMFRPYVTKGVKFGRFPWFNNDVDKTLDAIVARKNNLAADFGKMYKETTEQRNAKLGVTTPKVTPDVTPKVNAPELAKTSALDNFAATIAAKDILAASDEVMSLGEFTDHVDKLMNSLPASVNWASVWKALDDLEFQKSGTNNYSKYVKGLTGLGDGPGPGTQAPTPQANVPQLPVTPKPSPISSVPNAPNIPDFVHHNTTDVTLLSTKEKQYIKDYFKSNGTVWSNPPNKMWDTAQALRADMYAKAQAGDTTMKVPTSAQIFAALDGQLKKTGDPFANKVSKWLGTSKGHAYAKQTKWKIPAAVAVAPSPAPASPTHKVYLPPTPQAVPVKMAGVPKTPTAPKAVTPKVPEPPKDHYNEVLGYTSYTDLNDKLLLSSTRVKTWDKFADKAQYQGVSTPIAYTSNHASRIIYNASQDMFVRESLLSGEWKQVSANHDINMISNPKFSKWYAFKLPPKPKKNQGPLTVLNTHDAELALTSHEDIKKIVDDSSDVSAWAAYTKKSQYNNATTPIAYTYNSKQRLIYDASAGVFRSQNLTSTGEWKNNVTADTPLAAVKSLYGYWYPTKIAKDIAFGAGSADVVVPPIPQVTVPKYDIGTGDVSHLTIDQKNNIANLHLSLRDKLLLAATVTPSLWKSIKDSVDTTKTVQGVDLTPLQLLNILDAHNAKAKGLSNTSPMKSKVLDWLKTPSGYASVTGKTVHPPQPTFSEGIGFDTIPDRSVSDQMTFKEPYDESTMSNIWKKATKGKPWTALQKYALKTYTGGAYTSINNFLRGKSSTISDYLWKDANHIQAGMRPTPEPLLLYRGTGMDALGISTQDELKQLVGQIRVQNGYNSTSIKSGSAFGGNIKFKIEVPTGTPIAWVKNISQHKTEKEVLLPAGLHYEILEVIPHTFGTGGVVRVRIVPDPDPSIDEAEIMSSSDES
jgi:hypothetical protein